MQRSTTDVTHETFPSPTLSHRRADMVVHAIGLLLILSAGSFILTQAIQQLEGALIAAVTVYVLCALTSVLASCAYHFATWHEHRQLLRRVDHAAIYLSIAGTFTPFFVQAGTTWTMSLLFICWTLAAVAIWNKITNETVKSKWSTASYLGLGAIGLCALPDLTTVPVATLWCVIGGAAAYVVGTFFYAQKLMPFRYSIWHSCVNIGAVAMYSGIWMALFHP